MTCPAFLQVWRGALAVRPDVTTAAGRKALDAALRAGLREIEDPELRSHAADLCRAERRRLLAAADHLMSQRASVRRAERVLAEMLQPEARP